MLSNTELWSGLHAGNVTPASLGLSLAPKLATSPRAAKLVAAARTVVPVP